MMSDSNTERLSPFACRMDAIDAGKRPEHIATATYLFSSIAEIRELPNGYAFRLPGEPEMLSKVAEFIALERLCCPFFGFTLEVEPEGGPFWLHLTGRDGVKLFIQSELSEFMDKTSVDWNQVPPVVAHINRLV